MPSATRRHHHTIITSTRMTISAMNCEFNAVGEFSQLRPRRFIIIFLPFLLCNVWCVSVITSGAYFKIMLCLKRKKERISYVIIMIVRAQPLSTARKGLRWFFQSLNKGTSASVKGEKKVRFSFFFSYGWQRERERVGGWGWWCSGGSLGWSREGISNSGRARAPR